MPNTSFDDVRRTIEVALADGDPQAALAAIRPASRALAAEYGAEFRTLVGLLPESVWQADAVIASALGASYRAAGSPRGSSATGYFHAAEASLEGAGRDADPDRVVVWLGHSAALRSLGRIEAARECVERTRLLEAPGGVLSVPVRVELDARSALESGLLDLHFGHLDSARERLLFASGLATESLTRAEHIECLGALALVDYTLSNFTGAQRHAEEARTLAAGTNLLASGYAAPGLAAELLIAIERHDLPTAHAVEADLMVAACRAEWEPFAYVAAGYLRLAERDLPGGLDFLLRARQGYRTWDPSAFGADIGELLRAMILASLDQGDEAWAILRDLPPYEHHLLCPARAVAAMRLAHGDLRGAAEALESCERLGDDHSPRTIVEVRLLRAAIEYERGDFAVSDLMFDRALVNMSRTGSRAPLRSIPPGSLAALALRALDRPHSRDAAGILAKIAEATSGHGRLIEPLSHRELLVLAEVEKGSTVAGIAAALFISPNTVKTHLRRLYRKLGVTTRSDAIRKAKSLGLGRPVTRDSPA